MRHPALARRYARAVVLAARGDLDALERAAGELACKVAHPDLAPLLGDPRAPQATLRALLAEAAATPVLRGLVETLARRRRLALLPQVLAEVRGLVDEARGISSAEIVTAIEVPAEARAGLEAAVARISGRRIRPRYRVDPALVGGVVAKVGDRRYDASVEGQLRRFAALT